MKLLSYLNPGAVAVLSRFIERDVFLAPGEALFGDDRTPSSESGSVERTKRLDGADIRG